MSLKPFNIKDTDVGSRAEFSFVWELMKHTSADITPQYSVGLYRLDFVVEGHDYNVGIEIDGKKWHDIERDSIRDKSILSFNDSINTIIRFEGHDSVYNSSFCIWYLARFYEKIFLRPVKGSKPYYTNKEINEMDSSLEVSTSHITHHYESKLKLHGIYDINLVSQQENQGYTEWHFEVKFMTPDKQKLYFIEQERLIPYDETPNPFDYTHAKISKVLTMSRNI